jgi:hypothetical protein
MLSYKLGTPMLREADRSYYRKRAEDELSKAREAATPEAGRAHFMLAGFYFDLVFNDGSELRALGEVPADSMPGEPQLIQLSLA